jgi:transcriptional regulator with XRE-family HTH domain
MVLSKKNLGEKIKAARETKSKTINCKYTQQMLADELGISRGYIGDIENGRTYPNYVLLNKIAEACGVPFDYFGDKPSLGRIIKSWREAKGYSIERLALVTGLQPEILIEIENDNYSQNEDRRQFYSKDLWHQIAQAFGISDKVMIDTLIYEFGYNHILAKGEGWGDEKTIMASAQALDTLSEEITLFNVQPKLNYEEVSEEDLKLIARFRKLSPFAQQTILDIITDFENVDKAKNEQSAAKEIG